jgi:hypothetical protein
MVELEVAEHCSSLAVQSMLEAWNQTGLDLEPGSEQDSGPEGQNPFVLSGLVAVRCPNKPRRQFEVVKRYFAGAKYSY